METTITILGLHWGLYRDNGKENGNYGNYRCYITVIGYNIEVRKG